jgi:hypothetical protein
MSLPLNVLDVPKEVAREKLRVYTEALRQDQRREYRQLVNGFRHISAGRQVISLRETIAAGGIDGEGRPKLAVCRATARRCFLEVGNGRVVFGDLPAHQRRTHGINSVSEHWVRVQLPSTRQNWREFEAVVPIVPPDHRPRHGKALYKLADFHVLWEADWQPTVAPRDPALLRHLGGDLWVVWAVWDLTELERAVLVG